MISLREKLADLEHRQWAHWTKYLLEALGLWVGDRGQRSDIARWRRQCETPYEALTDTEKNSDRVWADKVLALCSELRKVPEGTVWPVAHVHWKTLLTLHTQMTNVLRREHLRPEHIEGLRRRLEEMGEALDTVDFCTPEDRDYPCTD
jgi:hypothetical protein